MTTPTWQELCELERELTAMKSEYLEKKQRFRELFALYQKSREERE